jgi:hypothetical protein
MMMVHEISATSEAVEAPLRKDLIGKEIGNLVQNHALIDEGQYAVVKTFANQMPYSFHEMGRLRALTSSEQHRVAARDVDLDEFDLYYLHILLWNKQKEEIAGGCRIGQTDDIARRFGPNRRLYTSQALNYSHAFLQSTGPAIEVSKVFIRNEYQKQYSPISLLLKGIGRFISHNPRYRAVIGAAPISNRYSLSSQKLILSFVENNCCENDIPGTVRSRTAAPSARSRKKSDGSAVQARTVAELSRLVSNIEPDGKGVPAYMKQFMTLGGKIVTYRIDSSSGNPITLLLHLDLTGCKPLLLKHYMGESGFKKFSDFHRTGQDRAA